MNSNNNQYDDDTVAQLTAMGFEAVQVQEALKAVNGNVDDAVNVLLGGGDTIPQPSSLVHGTKSQYSVENGKSACTCIALMGAALFLASDEKSVSSELLETMIDKGVAAYQQQLPAQTVEHLSAEQVLQSNAIEEFKSLVLMDGGVRQGLLTTSDDHHPLGLAAILQGSSTPETWVAALITKPPETVVVLLPPSNKGGNYILLDSHPRPGFMIPGSYARIHSSLDELVQSLLAIYPVTELGNDVPEMMAMMYNSFDVYPLTWTTTSSTQGQTEITGSTPASADGTES